MKETFKEYYLLNTDVKDYKDKALFVFDTCFFLNLYEYSKRTRDIFLDTLTTLSNENRTFMPHQIGLEYHNKRREVISNTYNNFQNIQNKITTTIQAINNEITKSKSIISENGVMNNLLEELKNCSEKINQEITKQKQENYPKYFENDHIQDKLTTIYHEKVCKPYTEDELTEIYLEGDKRFEKKIPPGYKDDAKGKNKYGDFIIWKQIIDIAQEKQTPIIFITDDLKSDWWNKKDNNNITCKIELIKEILEKTKVEFFILNTEMFMKIFNFGNESQSEVENINKEKDIETTWKTIVNAIQSPPLRGLLSSLAVPMAVTKHDVVIGFTQEFFVEDVKNPRKRKFLEEALIEYFGNLPNIQFKLISEKNL